MKVSLDPARRMDRRVAAPIEDEDMAQPCTHLSGIRTVTPSALGCEECLKTGDWWVHLRICRTCGHVGCCDQSPNRHATRHFQDWEHPLMRSFEPDEDWGWCYIDEIMFEPAPGRG